MDLGGPNRRLQLEVRLKPEPERLSQSQELMDSAGELMKHVAGSLHPPMVSTEYIRVPGTGTPHFPLLVVSSST